MPAKLARMHSHGGEAVKELTPMIFYEAKNFL